MSRDKNLEDLLLDPTELLKKASGTLLSDVGKVIAIITLLVACLVSFTEVSFYGIGTEQFTSTLLLLLIGAYLMFFSLEESGERHGERTDEYIEAKKGYKAAISRIKPSDLTHLEAYLKERSRRELYAKRQELLLSLGFTEGLLDDGYKTKSREERRARRRSLRIKARTLSVTDLLESDAVMGSGEIYHRSPRKYLRIIAKLIPTTVCMVFTASIMLTAKDELTAGAVIEGLVRLATLPIVGFRGYSFGYRYSKLQRAYQMNARTRILESYLSIKPTEA